LELAQEKKRLYLNGWPPSASEKRISKSLLFEAPAPVVRK
jgi:hypothetical protein